MGQKVNPKSFRLKINRTWDSTWFANKNTYANYINEDIKIREAILKRFLDSGISRIIIGRNAGKITITIFTSKPGLIIGRQGSQIDQVRDEFSKKFGNLDITIKEIKKPELEATLVADLIARQIEKRVAYRRAVKQAISKAMQSGAKGIKVKLGGRLNGVEIARRETFKEGTIPLHTFRSIIDYAEEKSHTLYGVIGVKVWIFKGESFKKEKKGEEENTEKE